MQFQGYCCGGPKTLTAKHTCPTCGKYPIEVHSKPYSTIKVKAQTENNLWLICSQGYLFPRPYGGIFFKTDNITSYSFGKNILVSSLKQKNGNWKLSNPYYRHYTKLNSKVADFVAARQDCTYDGGWPILLWKYPHYLRMGFNPRTNNLQPSFRKRITKSLPFGYIPMLEYSLRRPMSKYVRRILLPKINHIDLNLLYLFGASNITREEYYIILNSNLDRSSLSISTIPTKPFVRFIDYLKTNMSKRNFHSILDSSCLYLADAFYLWHIEEALNVNAATTWHELHQNNLGTYRRGNRNYVFSKPRALPEVPGFDIVAPVDSEELTIWGQKLHNCMAGYASNIAQGNTKVYGVFKDSTLQYAMEIRRGKIIQLLGKGNKQPTSDIIKLFSTEMQFKETR